MSRDRVVQLAPSTLALVLCRLDGTGTEEKGSQVFQDFQAANARCFWNRRLVRAVAEVSFQGWLESWVLLVQGQSANLEVLRDAWVRRALRPPGGFLITALGDVSPVQMNPVSQSQFIPLAEVLCCAISDMNAAQILVTQESLMEQLIKHYPGIATPSQEILYSTLGTLIKERKIYHTGEGYFIVTPQTYFITRKPVSHSKYGAAEDSCVSPPAITYLVSMESCADLTKANNVPSVSHCRSCSCFSENSTHNILGQQSINEGNGKEHKSVKDSKPSVQNQATSTSRDHHTCIKTKPQHLQKEKCNKKFGIGLFWRNVAKKEKSKKELVSFAAQFPPEEWPVRDEDNLDNIPRDIEHEIIKRINPVLTVDNLMKHTLMMQKAEEQKKYFSKGTSTEILKNKNAHNLKGSNKKKNNRLSKHNKKVQSNKEKNRKDPRLTMQVELDVPKQLQHQPTVIDDISVPDVFTAGNEDGNKPDVIYKKQICNPFESISYRDNNIISGCKPMKEVKKCRSGKDRKNISRPKSLDCSGLNVEAETRLLKAERPEEEYCEDLYHDQIVPVNEKDDLREYPPSYPQCSTLRIDDKFKHIKEHCSALGVSGEDGSPVFGDNQTKVLVKSERTWEHEVGNPYSAVSYCNKVTSINESLQHAQTSLGRSINSSKSFGRSNVGALEKNEPESHVCYSASEMNSKELPKYTIFSSSHNQELVEEDQMFYKKEDNDASSSFYFEGDTDEHIGTCQSLEMCKQNRNHNLYDLHEESHAALETTPSHWDPTRQSVHQFSSTSHHQEDYTSSVFSSDSSQSYSRPALHVKGSSCQPLSQYVLHHQEVDVDTAECIQPELCEGSIFDYCNSSDCNSMAETVQTSIKGSEEKPVNNSGQHSVEGRTCYQHTLKLFNPKNNPLEANQNENHSTTGDSGIESPRTRISLASNNSVIFEKLKKRTFLQNLEVNGGNKNEGLLNSSSLMQLTPAMNV
ncbi:storkhead-box protein 1 [Bufo gargarizans]|uniref:storkhead-box protein 1 n=1 Tax=Bufo gargarizans TaxID=30331 RepID=UPI001CF46D92|nr:storkhead-box protein 1 [Bufo gargarizans]